MQRVPQRGQASKGWRARVVPLAGALSLCALSVLTALPGCSKGMKITPEEDPLIGGHRLKKASIQSDATPARARSSKTVPALAAGTSSTSIAAVAQNNPSGGYVDPLVDSSGRTPLAIGGSRGTATGGWEKTGTGKEDRFDLLASKPKGATSGGFKLNPPQPVVEPVPPLPRGGVTPVSTWPASAGGLDYDQLQAQLRARRVAWQRQETWSDGFKFTCSVPHPENAEFNRVYEATARDYKSAIRAVIEQIDRDQQRR